MKYNTMKRIFVCLSLIGFIIVGCSKTNETTESGNNNGNTGGTGGTGGACDTVNMKYAANIQPIIQNNCYSCHGNGLSQNGVSLDSYDKVKKQADNGNLMGVISHASGYTPMPFGKPKLAQCDINKIKDWIERGANNN